MPVAASNTSNTGNKAPDNAVKAGLRLDPKLVNDIVRTGSFIAVDLRFPTGGNYTARLKRKNGIGGPRIRPSRRTPIVASPYSR